MIIKCGGQAKLDFGISGDPAPKVSWLLNGDPLPDDDKHCSAISTAVSIHYLCRTMINIV